MLYAILHNDLDALGCAVLLKLTTKDASFTFCNYTNIDTVVSHYLNNEKYAQDEIVIADICPQTNTLKVIDQHYKKFNNIILFDHHMTKENNLKKYPWAFYDEKSCGTKLVLDFVKKDLIPEIIPFVEEFVNAVQAWDLWKKDSPYRKRGEDLNSLFHFIEYIDFVEKFSKDIQFDKSETAREILYYLYRRRNQYIKRVIKDQLKKAPNRLDGYANTFKIIFSTEYVSELGDAILTDDNYGDLKYIVIVDPIHGTVSLRSNNPAINVGKIAKMLGGGGHFSASGFPFKITKLLEEKLAKRLNKLNY